jgi:hypothetical protein
MEIVSGTSVSLCDIFRSQAWIDFLETYSHRIRPSVIENVNKVVCCGTGSLGFSLFSCHCGNSLSVPFTCKSRFCSRCGKVACDNWMKRVISWALPDMRYRHIVFTIPEELRLTLILNRKAGLDSLFIASKNTLIQVFHDKFDCVPGIISIVHTFGSDIKWNPHVHVIITSGGVSSDKKSWIWTDFIPYSLLRTAWKTHLINTLRRWAKSVHSPNEYFVFNQLLDKLFKKQWYVNIGKILESLTFTIQYIGRYAKRPVIAETRLLNFDGNFVSFSFKDKETQKQSVLSFSVSEFIGKLIRHIPDKHHRMIRYSGLFASRCKNTYLQLIHSLLSSGKQFLFIPPSPNISWRNSIFKFTGIDPLLCRKCLSVMTLSSMTFKSPLGHMRTINFSP